MTTSSRIARLHAHCKAACACSRFTELNTLYDPHVHVALPSYQATWPAALCVVYSRAPRRGRARAGAGLPTAALARRRSGNRCEVCAHVGKGTKPTELWTLSMTPRVAGSLAVVHSAAVRPIAPSTARLRAALVRLWTVARARVVRAPCTHAGHRRLCDSGRYALAAAAAWIFGRVGSTCGVLEPLPHMAVSSVADCTEVVHE